MNNNTIITETFFDKSQKRKIGEGTYGKIYVDGTNAVKIFKDTSDLDDINNDTQLDELIENFYSYDPSIIREINVSIKMGNVGISPRVNKIYCDNQVGFSMELCIGALDNLWDQEINKSIDYAYVMRYFDSIIFQIVYGLAYAQQNKILHRDIKPSNIFLAMPNTQDNIYNSTN